MSVASPRPAAGVAGKLSLIWFLALGSVGLFFPFYSLFLKTEGGLSGSEVGLVMAMPSLVSIISQGLWGQLADRTGARNRLVALLALGTALGAAAGAATEVPGSSSASPPPQAKAPPRTRHEAATTSARDEISGIS